MRALTYNFANTPLQAAKAPLLKAQNSHCDCGLCDLPAGLPLVGDCADGDVGSGGSVSLSGDAAFAELMILKGHSKRRPRRLLFCNKCLLAGDLRIGTTSSENQKKLRGPRGTGSYLISAMELLFHTQGSQAANAPDY